MTNIETIIATLQQWPRLDDDELARQADIQPRQQVNQICRRLEASGRLRRDHGPRGKIINVLVAPTSNTSIAVQSGITTTVPLPVAHIPPQTSGNVLQEDQLKRFLESWLEKAGWTVEIAWGHSPGVDVLATRSNLRWVIEAKGTGAHYQANNNYFINVLGNILYRMKDETAKYSIALPDIAQFRGCWSRLPTLAKNRLSISVLFVLMER
jgi:hypothetical protein